MRPLIAMNAATPVVEGSVHMTDLMIVGSNLLLVLVTFALIRATSKDVKEIAQGEQRNTRLLIRVIAALGGAKNSTSKHRKE